jgi:DNA methylase
MNKGVAFHRGYIYLYSESGYILKRGKYHCYLHRKQTIDRWLKDTNLKPGCIQIVPQLYVHRAPDLPAVFGRGDYHWKHEPCWHAVKKGSKGNWASDRKQKTVWDIPTIHSFKNGKNAEEWKLTGHGTQKPVACMSTAIGNHDGDVYDPFLGSGTTMVAAHQLNRKCYGIEIDPKYCEVIVDRMLKLDPALEIKKNGVALDKQKQNSNAVQER